MKMLLEFDYKKATQVINYLAKKEGGQIDKLKLIKLVYFADRYHIRRYGRPIFNDTYFAMPYGPVGSSVKDIAELSSFLGVDERAYADKFIVGDDNNLVRSIADVSDDVFSESEIKALNFAYNEFGNKAGHILVDVAHNYPEWSKFESALKSKETSREPMSYLDFFKNPDNNLEDKFILEKEILDASKELYEEDYKISEYWK